jgi:hypothetical protein
MSAIKRKIPAGHIAVYFEKDTFGVGIGIGIGIDAAKLRFRYQPRQSKIIAQNIFMRHRVRCGA